MSSSLTGHEYLQCRAGVRAAALPVQFRLGVEAAFRCSTGQSRSGRRSWERVPVIQRTYSPALRFAQFLQVEASSGLVLLAAAAIALIWANSPAAGAYQTFWEAPLRFTAGGHHLAEPLRFWVNDALMALFFLLVGLEIRRELHEGTLANISLAALPVLAALGGVLVPALIYTFLDGSSRLWRGWAVPTATDIAFAVGVLSLLGRRVPASLRVLLLAIGRLRDIHQAVSKIPMKPKSMCSCM